jgi:hypothetical protein
VDADLQLASAEGVGYLRGLSASARILAAPTATCCAGPLRQQWIRTAEGQWIELTAATFSHDPTGKADRLDRFMGLEDGEFFLSHGGFVPGFTAYGQRFTRPATGEPPADILLPD